MKTQLGALKLKNPVITASGTCGFGEELGEYIDLERLGALTIKGLTVKQATGNPTPRIAETSAGILNSIGLENPGIKYFIDKKIGIVSNYKLPVLANISGHSIKDFYYLAERLSGYKAINGLEVNVSCPNITGGGMAFGTDSKLVYKIVMGVKERYNGTVIVKLTPNVTDITEIALAAEEAGADALSLINTILGMAIDVKSQKPLLANTFGGLSGPAVKPVALRMVYQVYRAVNIPIIGMGGITCGKDAVEFLLAGASAVAIGTATMIDPTAPIKILEGIKKYLKERGIDDLSKLIGKAHSG